jgi:hypothetical protein
MLTVLGTASGVLAEKAAETIFDPSIRGDVKFVAGLFASAPAITAGACYVAAWALGRGNLGMAGLWPRQEDQSQDEARRPGLARRTINILRPSVGN